MADATNRKLDVENTDEDRISRDDPLFELSQIIGYSEPRDAANEDLDEDAGQMDLEDALLRELEDFSDALEEDVSEAIVENQAAVDVEVAAEPAGGYSDPEPVISDASEDYEPAPSFSEPEAGEEDIPDTLEAELIDLLGGLGEKSGAEWSEETSAAEPEKEYFPEEPGSSLTGPDDEMSPQVPAAAPGWYSQEAQEEMPSGEPAREDDSEILDAFESALSEGLALSFDDEAKAAAESPAEEPSEAEEPFEFTLDLEESVEETVEYETETSYSADRLDSTYLNDVESAAEEIAAQAAVQAPPVLETADMPSSDMEAMQPLDLPDLPAVEEKGSEAVDIERELDAALSGYDNFDAGHDGAEPEMQAAATMAAAADTRLDFDMGAFEDDLTRDIEFVGHDMEAREGDAEYDNGDAREGAAIADSRKPKRGMTIAAVVGGIAILGAVGAFGLTSRDGGEAGAPVLVKADSEPTKIVPEDPGGKEVPNQDRAVYGEVDGNGETAPVQETLVSTSEEPIDLGAGTPAPASGMPETAKVEDRLAPDTADAAAPAGSESAGAVLAPRRVRTVIVKPDGTLVETAPEPQTPVVATAEPAAVAPEPAATPIETDEPVRRIDMAETAPQAQETPSEPVVTAEETSPVAEQPEPEAATAEQLAAIAEPDVSGTAGATEEAEPTAVVRQALRAPASIPERPADQPVTIVGSQQPANREVAAAPTAPQAPVATQTVAPGTYTVQIASQPSAELAQKTAADLSRVYADVIGGRSITIQQAEIEGRGTYHRVRIIANGRQDAVAVCERIKQEGGSCFVAR
jgi:hypothetical protein